MDFHKLSARFKQFGGIKLVVVYARLGVLLPIVNGFFQCLLKRQSFKGIYPKILKKIEPFLIGKYEPVLKERKNYYLMERLEHQRSCIVWFCWLQGIDNATELVHVCYESMKRHLSERKIIVIDANNWKEYIELPEYVVRKWEKGSIPAANFSDLLRLELLIKYGGTWVDATVLCTGFGTQMTQNLQNYLDSDLFLFQYTQERTTEGISISNWFISAHSNNVVLMAVRDMLMAYWRDYDCTLDYYMFHLFFAMAAKEYPEEIQSMPYGSSQRCITLMRHWNEPFNQEQWDRLVSKVAFHKLSYRVDGKTKNNKNNYYNYILLTN